MHSKMQQIHRYLKIKKDLAHRLASRKFLDHKGFSEYCRSNLGIFKRQIRSEVSYPYRTDNLFRGFEQLRERWVRLMGTPGFLAIFPDNQRDRLKAVGLEHSVPCASTVVRMFD